MKEHVEKIGDWCTARAPSKRAAHAAALELAGAMLSGSYQPRLLTLRGALWIVWREPNGWHYSRVTYEGADETGALAGYYGPDETAELTERAARRHAAQREWHANEPDDCMPDVVTNARDRRECRDYFGTQRAFIHGANVHGLQEQALHQWACENGRWFEQRDDGTRPNPATCCVLCQTSSAETAHRIGRQIRAEIEREAAAAAERAP